MNARENAQIAVMPPAVTAHDAAAFAVLARSYCFQTITARRRLFVRLLLDELAAARAARQTSGDPSPVAALDIGCGHGIGAREDAAAWLRLVREHCDELIGVEPDPDAAPPDGILSQLQHAPIEQAALPENHFDLAYAVFVVEHVDDPVGFLRAVRRALRPGGVFLFITPSGRHLMPRLARLCMALKLDAAALRLVRGKAKVREYHYPTRYRMNTAKAVDQAAATAGFATDVSPGKDASEGRYVYFDTPGKSPYFPGPLRWVQAALNLKRRLIHDPTCLTYLVGRLRKPGGEPGG
jgi:SAM-dependent methyltransferase